MPVFEGKFANRRDAEMAIERLVQEFDIDRNAIRVAPEGTKNSAGEQSVGLDAAATSSDAVREGEIIVSVDDHSGLTSKICEAFQEFSSDPA